VNLLHFFYLFLAYLLYLFLVIRLLIYLLTYNILVACMRANHTVAGFRVQ
jgi:hypothetical protein